jgi:hypothetical protein
MPGLRRSATGEPGTHRGRGRLAHRAGAVLVFLVSSVAAFLVWLPLGPMGVFGDCAGADRCFTIGHYHRGWAALVFIGGLVLAFVVWALGEDPPSRPGDADPKSIGLFLRW